MGLISDLKALPPHSVNSEQALLGAILHHASALDGVLHIVKPEDFYERVNGHIFQVMCDRRSAGDPIDFGLMKAVLGNADLGGTSVGQYLADLVREATTVNGAPGYARMIRDAARMRTVLEVSQSGTASMMDGSIRNPAEQAALMIEALDEVVSSVVPSNLRRVQIGAAAGDALDRARDAKAGRVRRGAPYGIPALDRATLGMREDQLIVLAGRPGMGKTTAAIHFAIAAARHGYGVGFVSLEMSAGELAERALAAVAYDPRETDYITYRAIAEGVELTEAAFARLERARQFHAALPFEIEQQPRLTLAQIAARARQLKARLEREGRFLGVLIVDHIGLILPSKRYAGNRVQEISEITSTLKALAKELGIAVLALSQLNRGVEDRPDKDKRPVLRDLRESGSIEQDADVVIALFREAYYLEHKVDPSFEEQDRLAHVRDTLELEILKQRGGPTPRIECFCDIACNVLAEMSR